MKLINCDPLNHLNKIIKTFFDFLNNHFIKKTLNSLIKFTNKKNLQLYALFLNFQKKFLSELNKTTNKNSSLNFNNVKILSHL